MSWLAALGFGAPLALLGLLALPAIWWLVRRTPPKPTVVDFPPTALMRDLVSPEDTPATSPLWLLLLRLGLAALLVAALSEPWWNATGDDDGARGPLWLVLDDGWAAAEDWPAIRDAADRLLARAEARDRPVVLAATADGGDQPLAPVRAASARTRLATLAPRPWVEDRASLLPGLAASAKLVPPGSLVWLSHGLDLGKTEETTAFAAALEKLANGAPRTLSRPARLDRLALTAHDAGTDGLLAHVIRPARSTGPTPGRLAALDARGRTLAETPFAFAPGDTEAEAKITLPAEILAEAARLEIVGRSSAGATRLLDDRGRRRAVGLVSGAGLERDRPLLSQLHWLAAALTPFADLRRPETADLAVTIDDFLKARVSVIVAADVGTFPADTEAKLKAWVEAGGLLVRFAGPRLVASRDEGAATRADPLLPVTRRATDRSLGGALTWDAPRGLAPFPETSPFAGLPTPKDVRVTRQILAEPAPGLADRTWASLEDGTPLVTAAPLGRGRLVFFHVGADTAWSTLPMGETFVEMLRRIVALGPVGGTVATGTPGAATAAASDTAASALLPPWRLLDGFGRLSPPGASADARPIAAKDIAAARPSRLHPPGLWGTEGATVALQPLRAGDELIPFPDLPGWAAKTRTDEKPLAFGPALLVAALVLALLDGLLALAPRALLARLRRLLPAAAALLAFALPLALADAPTARAAGPTAIDKSAEPPASTRPADPPAGALAPRFAWTVTGDPSLDDVSRRGMIGLSQAVGARTSFEPAEPVGVDPASDDLSLYALIYWPISASTKPLPPAVMARVGAFMKSGGTVLFDTRDADEAVPGRVTAASRALRHLLDGIDPPPLEPVGTEHVLSRTFYLLRAFPGRSDAGRLWAEAAPETKGDGSEPVARPGDGVSPLLVTGNDLAGAWAIDDDGEALPMTSTAPDAREMALRVGINIAMYVLTGNYKADQVHVPLLLKRLGR